MKRLTNIAWWWHRSRIDLWTASL